MGLICTLTLLIAETYGTPEIALTTYVVFFMNQPDRMGSLVQTLAITVLITVVLAGLFLLAPAMIASPPWRIAAMAGLSFGLMFLNSASKLQGVAATVALVVVYCLALLGSSPSGTGRQGAAVRLALRRHSRRRLHRCELAARTRPMAADAAGPGRTTPGGSTSPGRPRRTGGTQLAHARRAGRCRGAEGLADDPAGAHPPQHLDALQALSDRVMALEAAVQLMVETPDTLPPQDAREAMVRTLSEMAGILTRGGYPACVEAIDGVAQATPAARQPWLLFNAALAGCGEPRAEAAPAQPASGFFLPDAFHHPRHIRHALKVTGAALLCYLFYTATSWPGIHTALITCFIVSLGTAADSIEKLQLRLTGCVAGAACGIGALLLVIPQLTDIGGLCLLVFAGGASVGAWVAAGTRAWPTPVAVRLRVLPLRDPGQRPRLRSGGRPGPHHRHPAGQPGLLPGHDAAVAGQCEPAHR
jgi:multidrug resistance protein MdtO